MYTSAGAYIAVGALTMQLGESVFPALGFPGWAPRLLIILVLLGFPFALIFAWIFDISPAGFQRTEALEGEAAPQRSAISWNTFAVRPKRRTPRPIEVIEEAPDPERVRRASLAFVRHELRTPINGIIGYSEMLLDDAHEEGDAAAASDLARIVQCGREILAVVERSLDADRISREHGRDLASYGEQIRADLRDPLSAVNGYTEMLIEESSEHGRSARVADLQRVQAAARQLLDLSNDIVAIATQAPGTVSADMIKGATLAEGVLAKIRAVQEHDVQADRQGRLLVVDDSPLNRDLLSKQLARKGYFVTSAENGRVALELMAEQPFDLVLLDVLMPELDGVGVLLRMKADDRLCDIPVIMLSALDEVDSVVRCLELGAADFVSKPFHPTLLDARINSALNARADRGDADVPAAGGGGSAVERLMAGTLPDYVLQRLRKGETRLLDGVANAAVYFVDIDQAVASADPAQRAALTEKLIELARRAGEQNGAIVLLHGIGLAMAAGFPQPADDAAERMARTALMFSREAEEAGLRLRSGLHAGAVYGAVVGSQSLSYFVWGDGVDLSRRLALSADRGTISMSAACHALLKDHFVIAGRGVVEVAGHGQMRAYVLEGEAAIAR